MQAQRGKCHLKMEVGITGTPPRATHTHTHEAERDASVDQVPPYSLHEGPATDNCDFSVSLPDSQLDDGILLQAIC